MNVAELERRLEESLDSKQAGRKNPVNVVDRIRGRCVYIEECVLCGGRHSHGHAYDVEFLEGGVRRARVAHCTDDSRGEEYDLLVTEETEGRELAVGRVRRQKEEGADA